MQWSDQLTATLLFVLLLVKYTVIPLNSLHQILLNQIYTHLAFPFSALFNYIERIPLDSDCAHCIALPVSISIH